MAIIIPRLKVAVAGTAFGGDVQIPVFQTHPRTQVVAVSSGRADRAKQAASTHGIPAHYTNFEEMLDKEKPDLVSIATPPETHFHMTMAALRRGIHVLCEKPFALDLSQAKEMKAAADRTPVVAMIDYEFRFAAARAYATELLEKNYVGEVRMADFNTITAAAAIAYNAGSVHLEGLHSTISRSNFTASMLALGFRGPPI